MEGWCVEGGGEVADAPVAELEEVAEGGGSAALGVEAHRRSPGASVSINTTGWSGPSASGAGTWKSR